MNPSKESSMLIDIQYVKQNRSAGTPDYLYIIWKDLNTNKKYMQAVPEPMIDIYFEKHEFRTHKYNKNYEHIENLEKKTVKYKDIPFAIANDMGEQGQRFLSNVFQTRNYSLLKNLYLYPYVFGADYDAVAWYRVQWVRTLDNNIPKKLNKGFLDIEVDGIEVPGMPVARTCPINAITLIDDSNGAVYTFILTYREYIPKDTKNMTQKELDNEVNRKNMYQHMHDEQTYMIENPNEIINELHEMFDESYGDLDYNLYFYSDERKMLVHFFQLINTLKLDIIGIWNISFDIPYIMDRLESLGLDPKEVMSHPDFPVKQCYFKADKVNHEIKNKTDSFHLTSYTTFIDQMELYAQIRKGGSELRSFRLNVIAEKELKDNKLDYSDDGDFKTLPYINFKKFIIYNIKDVLLQYGIEQKTSDFDTLYISSYKNATPYDKVFKQTVKLRNAQYIDFLDQGIIPGDNINIYNSEPEKVDSDDEDDEDSEFEGALVADPVYNEYVGVELYGRPTNNIFNNSIDMDMSAFYPNSIDAMNIDASTLIFKTIMDMSQYNICGGELPFNGITGDYFDKDSDGAKECIDNFQTGNYLTTGTKWFNMPNVHDIFNRCMERISK